MVKVMYTELGTQQVVTEYDLLFWKKNKLMLLEKLRKMPNAKNLLFISLLTQQKLVTLLPSCPWLGLALLWALERAMVIKIIMIICLALIIIGLLMLLWCDYELEKITENLRRLDIEGKYLCLENKELDSS